MDKNALIKLLPEIIRHSEVITAAWLGGSDATGRADDLSDIDLVIVSDDDKLPFELLEKNLPVKQRYIVHDGPYIQRFYVLEGTQDTFYLDVVVLTDKGLKVYQEYFNQQRHGLPQILFDKNNILREASLSPTIEKPALDKENELARFEIMFRTFTKEAMRGKYIDAYNFYLRLVTILIRVLRVKHCPQKHDFGFRYLYVDLPEQEAVDIEKLLQVSNLEMMKNNSLYIKNRVESLMKDIP